MNYIEENLYAFYRYFGSAETVKYVSEKDYSVVMSENGCWPQMIFNIRQSIPPGECIPKIVSDISQKAYPSFFIAPESYLSRAHSGILKKCGVVPVKMLCGMNFSQKEKQNIILNEEIIVSELNSENLLIQFGEIVNKELLADDIPIKPAIFKDLMKGAVKLFGLFKNQILISATLVLISDNIAGFYFIVTRKEFQKKGYATALINSVRNELFDNQINELILHANQFASELYQKIGFVNQNRFVIYKKL